MKLRDILTIGTITLASLFPMKKALAQTTEDPKPKTSVNLNADLVNESRFWGLPFLENMRYMQTLNIGKGNLGFSLAGHYDLKRGRLFDVDTGISYFQPISDKLSAYLGGVRFDFNITGEWDDAALLYAGLAADVPLNPSIAWNRLIKFGGGDYIEGSISQRFPLGKSEISVTEKVGYNHQVMRDESGLSHLETAVDFPIQLSNGLTVVPHLNYFYSLSDEVKTGLCGGVTVNWDIMPN